MLVAATAILRQFDAAKKALAESKPSGVASNDIAQKLAAITLLADQGYWDDALSAAKAAVGGAEAAGPFFGLPLSRHRT